MNLNLQVSESIVVNVPAERMWDVLTNPEIIKEYLFGTQTVTDWKVGSEVIFQGEYNGHKYRDHGIVKENIPNKKLSYSYWSGFSGLEDKPENYGMVIYDIEHIDDTHIKFTWTQKGFPDEERQKHSQSGMAAFLQQIKQIAERK